MLIAAVAVYGLIQFVGFNMLYSTFPEAEKSVTEANDEFELLVETENGAIPKAYERLIKKYGLSVEPAFQLSDPTLSRLDEFLAIGIPDEAENKTTEIVRELKRLSATQFIEYNEVIQLEIKEDVGTIPTVNARNVKMCIRDRGCPGWISRPARRYATAF